MSAWIVSKKHIDYLVYGALTVGAENGLSLEVDSPSELGQRLWDENFKSVNYRYNEAEVAPEYGYEQPEDAIGLANLHKQLACYDYQTCEHDGYEGSMAKDFVVQMQAILERIDPDVESKWNPYPWGIG